MKLKDRAREKAERRSIRKSETENRDTKGPPIAWDEAGGTANTGVTDLPPPAAAATDDSAGDVDNDVDP